MKLNLCWMVQIFLKMSILSKRAICLKIVKKLCMKQVEMMSLMKVLKISYATSINVFIMVFLEAEKAMRWMK